MPILRFAPSPNGQLHLGHAYSALYVDHWARRLGGEFLVRLEDTDITRCKPEFADAIVEDLHWLSWPEPVLVQSQRFALYASEADRLRARGLLYECDCSRQEIAARATGTDPDGAPLYDGKCRIHGPAGGEGRLVQTRLDLAKALALTGPLTFTLVQPTPLDRPQVRYARPELWGDVVLQRKGTPTSYHLSVVVDDAAQKITHVTRGRDMEPSTDLHALLQMLLGLSQPLYNFHKLIMGADGRKLSKSKGSPSLSDLQANGWTAADVRRELGF